MWMGVSVNYSWKYMAGVFARSPIFCKTGGEVVNFHLVWLL